MVYVMSNQKKNNFTEKGNKQQFNHAHFEMINLDKKKNKITTTYIYYRDLVQQHQASGVAHYDF